MLERHPNPAWRDLADTEIMVLLDFTRDPATHCIEALWCKSITENRLELCCIPFYAYNLSLGDIMIVEPSTEGRHNILGVERRSGRFTFRAWSEAEYAMELRALLQEARSMNCLVEVHPDRCGLAIDAESAVLRNRVQELLGRYSKIGHIQFEKSDGLLYNAFRAARGRLRQDDAD